MRLSARALVTRVHRVFTTRGLTLAVAESCTGGLVADLITDLAGASVFFDASVVTYSNEAKAGIIGVRKATLAGQGAVSREAAREMAEGVLRLRKTDFALAVTGNLGPSAMDGSRVGQVFLAVASHRPTVIRGVEHRGNRRTIKRRAAAGALQFLLETVERGTARRRMSSR